MLAPCGSLYKRYRGDQKHDENQRLTFCLSIRHLTNPSRAGCLCQAESDLSRKAARSVSADVADNLFGKWASCASRDLDSIQATCHLDANASTGEPSAAVKKRGCLALLPPGSIEPARRDDAPAGV
jgi:hypothetical protein